MCGIVALWRCATPGTLKPMLDVIKHRGPDDSGEFYNGDSAIGARRLSIIDVVGGHQPVFSEDGIAVVLNGEIYNHADLRIELRRLGRTFRSNCDTEVLAHGFSEWGIATLLSKVRGMYAFAALDSRSGTLTVARDRLGIKPLYWSRLGGGYVFASEIKSIFKHPGSSPAVNEERIAEQIACRFVSGPETIFKDIKRVAPASYWVLDTGRDPVEHKYWAIPDPGRAAPRADALHDQIRELFQASITDRLVSDVPVGALLSGGLDSSIVVSQMTAVGQQPPLTFTVGFGNPDLDERPRARVVSREFGTEHYEEEVSLNATDQLADAVWYFDEPVGDAAALPTLLIAQTAAKHVKVVLTGEGSDELFGGYPRYRLSALADRLHRLPGWLWRLPATAATRLPGLVGHVAKRMAKSRGDVELRNSVWMSGLDPQHLRRLFPTIETGDWRNAYGHGRNEPPWRIDMDRWLLNDILLKVDRMSMGASIEARVPFLDHRLVEYVFSLPTAFRRRRLDKQIIRSAFRSDLPATSVSRKKAPFKPPLKEWFRSETGRHLTALVSERGSFAVEFLGRDAVLETIGEHQRGADHGLVLWQLYTLETWWRKFFKTSWH